MATNKEKYEDTFGRQIKNSLRAHKEPVPKDFADNVLKRLRVREQQKLLAKVILQERLALAGCIMVPILAAALIPILGERGMAFSAYSQNLYKNAAETVLGMGDKVGLWAFVMTAGAFVIYNVFDQFLTDS